MNLEKARVSQFIDMVGSFLSRSQICSFVVLCFDFLLVVVTAYRMKGSLFVPVGTANLDGDPPLLSSGFEVFI